MITPMIISPFEVVLPHKDIGHPSPGWSWPGQSAIKEIIITNHDENDKDEDGDARILMVLIDLARVPPFCQVTVCRMFFMISFFVLRF